jgi:hypothetical protein
MPFPDVNNRAIWAEIANGELPGQMEILLDK